ncbi:hypothetical protein H2204_000408 [Knufia peltigerae]|uniref:Xylanolytic transcriptional activator regulatory domain-containing protein n=1 Tax=Knufia peltigerae TaxID=1002370 RepID=A0AA38YEL1_9EURO|nr:hypothetical protein H2204_000408 [Knufia peltigerae]
MSEILALVRQPGEDDPTFNATRNISLLVLQAIIFGASAFVPLATLKPMGFSSREEARINLYRRAIALHDLELEADDVSVAQARLIFTHWVEIEDQRNPWYWMGSAVSKIQSMDLREILGDTTICRSRLGTLKRLWWSCVIRDTILALGGRFLPRFRPEECEICMLSFGDFPSTCQPSHITASSTTPYAIDKGTIRGRSVAISVEMAKMSLCLNRVLWVQSSVSSILRSPMLVKLGQDQRIYRKLMAAEIDACFRKVKAWFVGLHEDARWQADQPNQDQSHKGSNLGRVLLRMAYYTAINCLYRPQVLPSDSETAFAVHTEEREYSTYCRKLLWAAQGVARCSEDLVRNHLGEHLPSFSTSFVIPALVVLHARFRHSQNSSSQHKAMPGYASCMLLLRTLRARYTCAERANTYLDRLMPGHGENDESDQSPAQTLTETTTQPSSTGLTQASPQMPPRTSVNLDGRLEDNRQASSSGSDLIALQEHYGTNDTPSAASSDYEHLALLNQEFLSFAEHQRDAFTGTTPLDLSWIETDDFEDSLFDMSILPTLPPNDFDVEEENLVNTFGLNNNQEEVLTG